MAAGTVSPLGGRPPSPSPRPREPRSSPTRRLRCRRARSRRRRTSGPRRRPTGCRRRARRCPRTRRSRRRTGWRRWGWSPSCGPCCGCATSASCGCRCRCPASVTGWACWPSPRPPPRWSTASPARTSPSAAVLLFRLLPTIVLGPLAGAFADRFDRRKTMVVTDVLRFGFFASIPLVDNLIWLFVAQFLIEALSMFWIPAKDAAVPNMLRKDQLEPANQLSLVTTYGLTPVLAAIVFALLNSTGGRPGVAVPGGRRGRRRALPQRADLPRRRDRHLEPALDQRPRGPRRRLPSRRASSARCGTASPSPGTPRWSAGLVVGITGAFVAAGVIIATGQAFANALGGGQAAYGLLFGAVFIGLGLGIALGPSVAHDLARERIFGVAIVGAGVDGRAAWPGPSRCGSPCCSSSSWASSPASPTWPASRCWAPRSRTRCAAGPSRSCSRWCGRR